MLLKYSRRVMVLLSALFLLSSCKKYINLEPKDATYDQVFWSNGANVDKALSGIYKSIRDAYRAGDVYNGVGSFFTLGDLPADEFWLGGDYWNYNTLVPEGKLVFSYTPYIDVVNNWSRYYAIINLCHLVVENADKIDDSKFDETGSLSRKQLVGEGHFLRAFTYFYITKNWGDAVLVKESLKDPTNIQPIVRSKEEDVLNYCIEDLKKAIELMDFNTGTGRASVRADKGAALALLAQVYAWKHDYTNAKKYCDLVISSGNYVLESAATYENIWKGQSSENIFELFMKYDAVNKEASSGFFKTFLHDPLIKDKSESSSWPVNKDRMLEVYYNNTTQDYDTATDIRFHKTITGFESDYPMLIKYADVNYYDANQPGVYVVDNNLVLLRLAETYLLKAEAEFKLGNETAAQEALNVVKRRAGLDDYSGTGAELYDEIVKERYRELWGEGYLAYDLIRMNKLQDYFPGIYTPERISKKGYYWPLDMRTLLPQDPLLTQNEWWKNH